MFDNFVFVALKSSKGVVSVVAETIRLLLPFQSLPSSPQRWFPLSPPTHKAEDPLFGGEAEGDGNGDVGRWTNATEQRRATDFAHYNPVIQVCWADACLYMAR